MRTPAPAARIALALSALVGTVAGCSEPAPGHARAAARYAQCAPCHGENGEGNPTQIAPAIAGLPAWYVESQLTNYRASIRGTHFDDIGGMRMKAMAVTLPTDDDVKDMAQYVSQLPTPKQMAITLAAAPTAGRQTYAVCAACHGADGAGNPALKAPPIAGHADWYVYRQLKNFKHGARGANPKDTNGATMRGIALGLSDEQMRNVAQFVAELPVRRTN
jgi:cytochrome c oxidase subunit 2